MSDSQRIKDLETLLPTIKISKYSDSFKSLEVPTLSFRNMATTETFKYYLKVTNPIDYNLAAVADGATPPNVTVNKTSPVASVAVRRLRNKVSSTLPSTLSIGVYDSENGWPVTVALPKTSVQKKDRITVEFSAPNAKTVTHLMAILT